MQKMFTKEEIHRKTYLPKRKTSGKMSLISLCGLRGELPIVGPGAAAAPPGVVSDVVFVIVCISLLQR